MQFTSWGYQDCQPDVEDGAYGGMMTRLLLRHLPQHYGSASALALFPFQVIYIIFSGLIVRLSPYLYCVGTREDAQVHEERARHRQVFGIQLEPFEHSNLSACH
jgi:hypothetical protein